MKVISLWFKFASGKCYTCEFPEQSFVCCNKWETHKKFQLILCSFLNFSQKSMNFPIRIRAWFMGVVGIDFNIKRFRGKGWKRRNVTLLYLIVHIFLFFFLHFLTHRIRKILLQQFAGRHFSCTPLGACRIWLYFFPKRFCNFEKFPAEFSSKEIFL